MYHPIIIKIFPYPFPLWNQSHWRPWHLYWTFLLEYPFISKFLFLGYQRSNFLSSSVNQWHCRQGKDIGSIFCENEPKKSELPPVRLKISTMLECHLLVDFSHLRTVFEDLLSGPRRCLYRLTVSTWRRVPGILENSGGYSSGG